MKVLLVDDNENFRNALKFMLLDHFSAEVILEAGNGLEALEIVAKDVPDIIFMDIEMPVLNGIDATKKILWKKYDVKIIAITMYEDNAYLSELISAGFKGFISKRDIYKGFEKAINSVMNGELYFPENLKI